jgi:hypothetical protein
LKRTAEFRKFDAAMGRILKADPKAVKAAVDAEIQEHAAEREERGERKRGRKPKRSISASDRASSAKH